MPSRKSSKNSNDYGRAYVNGGYNGSYGGYSSHTYGYGPPKYGSYNKYQHGGASSGYGSYNPYGGGGAYAGSMDRRGGMRGDGLYPGADPYRRGGGGGYEQPGMTGGPAGGVDDKWRHTYPYVPTSYNYHHNARGPPESVDLETEGGEEEERDHWGSKWEFIFSCVGLSVGIGNVWRFPTLAYENGGGSFFIAYFVLLLLIGKPMYYMELALGQFAQRGPVAIWKLCPLGIGVGLAQCTVSLIVAIYYNVVMAYCLYYIFASFSAEVPWSVCSPNWFQEVGADSRCYERNAASGNGTNVTCLAEDGICETSAEQFFRRAVLGVHNAYIKEITEVDENNTEVVNAYALSELGNIGEIKWDITLCLLLSWIVVFACLVKGIKSSGKVVYFTATFPYVLLLALLVFGCTLEGAADGIKAFFVPRAWTGPKTISDPQVWRKAAEQMFFSLSVSWGGLIMFGSYNKFHHKVHITATVISSLDFVTSVIAGIVIFSILGQLKLEAGLENIEDVVKGGTGLAFIAYPEALSRLWVPQLWSVMFFFMLFLLGLDSEFALLETVLTAFYDSLPNTKKYQPLMVFLICLSCFLISLPCVSSSGSFVFQIMDDYGGGMSVMWIAIVETMFLMWVYGVRNFAADIDFMLQTRTSIVLKVLWALVPILLVVVQGFSLASFEAPTARNALGTVYYPGWVHSIGVALILVVILQIPLWAVVTTLYYMCVPAKRVKDVVKPTAEWGPGDRHARKEYLARRTRSDSRAIAGYDNQMMAAAGYPYYYPGYQSYHM